MVALGGRRRLTRGRHRFVPGTSPALNELPPQKIGVADDIRINGVPWPRRSELEHDGQVAVARDDILEGMHVQIFLRNARIGVVTVVVIDSAGKRRCTDARMTRGGR